MSDLPPQFIEIKSGRNTFDCVHLTRETKKQQALGKHHYDDMIKANFDFRAQLRAGRNALALRARAF